MAMRRPAQVFPPGEFLREELEERGWTQADLAEILGRPPRLVNEIIQAKRSISPETAKGLAAAFETSAEYWMSLESSYQLWRVRDEGSDPVAKRAKLFRRAPIKEMQRRGWIEVTTDVDLLEQRVLRFLHLNSLDDPPQLAHAARRSTSEITPTQEAWLARARQLAKAVSAGPFTPAQAREAVAQLKSLMHVPQEARHVPRILAEAGIRLVIVQPLPGSKIDGATFWIDGLPVIALSFRFDRIDNFWFVLLHELGHVVNGDGRDDNAVFIDSDLGNVQEEGRPPSEKLADAFAQENLVPRKQLDSFVARVRPLYSAQRIAGFAEVVGVHPGLVVGQLQHRGELAWSSFKAFMVPVREFLIGSALTDGWGSTLSVPV